MDAMELADLVARVRRLFRGEMDGEDVGRRPAVDAKLLEKLVGHLPI